MARNGSPGSARTFNLLLTTGWDPVGLGSIPNARHGAEVAIIGAGIAGLVAAYELMKIGLKPLVYEVIKVGFGTRERHNTQFGS